MRVGDCRNSAVVFLWKSPEGVVPVPFSVMAQAGPRAKKGLDRYSRFEDCR